VNNYKKIAYPLTSLVKNNSFVWSKVVAHAFVSLKDSMFIILVLIMLDFTKKKYFNVMPQVEVLE